MSKTHISGLKLSGHAEYVQDDDLWLVRTLVDNGVRARPDNEFFVRMTPCAGHPTKAEDFEHGIVIFANIPANLLRKAMDIGIEILGNNGFLPDEEDEHAGSD